jgi:2,3-bisphosphoglycerate-independent phosphoglycerate mutase
MSKKTFLIIMDGWGIGQVPKADAIRAANTPFIDSLYTKYPHSTLLTCGESVGLPSGQMGNSEVGHLNIGAGRIVYQELQRINRAFAQHEVEINPHFQEIIAYARSEKKPIHLMGLVSDGGVHSHIQHFKALLDILSQEKDIPVYIHAFSDGRDTDPKSGVHFMKELMDHCALTTGKIASLTGRYYAMDRDKRWDRIKVAYDALVHGVGTKSSQLLDTMAASYEENITDEFILPIICTDNQQQPHRYHSTR